MEELKIRKIVTILEEFHMESGKALEKPLKKAAAIAVIKNPYAGVYQEDLSLLVKFGEELGRILPRKAIRVMEITPDEVDNYGKGGIVGLNGELEHVAAIIHPGIGATMRDECGGKDKCKAIIPSAKKRASAGATLDIPLHFKNACYVRSHYDAMEVRVTDAPAPDEILIAVALTSGGRPLARIGGLRKEEVKGLDGQR